MTLKLELTVLRLARNIIAIETVNLEIALDIEIKMLLLDDRRKTRCVFYIGYRS